MDSSRDLVPLFQRLCEKYGIDPIPDASISDYVLNVFCEEELNSDDAIDLLNNFIENFSSIVPRAQFVSELQVITSVSCRNSASRPVSQYAVPISFAEAKIPIHTELVTHEAPIDDLTFLRDLFPSIEANVIEFVFNSIALGNRDHAAETLLDNSSPECIVKLKRRMLKDETARMKQASQELSVRNRLLEENEECSDDESKTGKAKRVKHKPVNRRQMQGYLTRQDDSLNESKPTSNRRFLEGMLVATKGEKFIIEDLTKEYDGGSRGKIKSKGKRGKGWV